LKGKNITEYPFKEIDFYWLPSEFSKEVITSQSLPDYTLNREGRNADFIYKTITLRNKAIFYVNEGYVTVGKLGVLNVESGCTFYSKFHQQQALSNFNFDPAGKINVKTAGYICVETGTEQHTVYSLPELAPNFTLNENYVLGVNPTIPVVPNNACESPCQFLAFKNPKVSFKPTVVLPTITGGTIKVNVTDVFTTYCEKYKWEVVSNGIVVASKESKGTPIATELSEAIPFTFLDCSEYDIRLSIGCNQINFLQSATVRITTKPNVNAGIEETVCETKFPYTLTGFQPIASNGIGAGFGQANWTANTTNFSTTSAGVVSITAATPRDLALRLTYTYQDLMGCSVSAQKTLFVSKVPVAPVLSIPRVPCEGEDFEILVSNDQDGKYVWSGPNGFSYEWYSGYLKREKSVKATMDGAYSAYVTRNGCQGAAGTVSLSINPLPIITIPEPEKHLCKTGANYPLVANTKLPVAWTSLVGVTANGSNLTKTGGTANVWNAGAFSTQSITNGGYVEGTSSENNTYKMLGLNTTNVNANFNTLRYAIYFSAGTLNVFENGVNRNIAGITFAVNDIARIAVVDNVVKYYKNGTVFYTSTLVPTYPLYADVSLYSTNATLKNINMSLPATGIWSGTGVISTGVNAYAFTPSLLALGEYNLTYTYTLQSTGCVKTATQKIIIGPKIELGANETVCLNSPAFVPSVTSPTGGTWSVAGVNLTNNLFNPATRAIGDYIATYTFTDTYGCTNTATKTITVKGTPIVNITQTPPTGLQYSYYENNSPSAWGGMPSFTNLAPARTGTATNINLTPATGRARNFALVFEGSLKVPTSGNYTFNLSSVDGSKLYINNTLIANNDGQHNLQSRTGSVVLATNQKISIRVEYFSGNDRVPSLNLQWSGPGTPLQTIPNSAFSYPILFCEGTSLTLTASTGTSFLWSNGSTQGLSTEVTTPGTYSVTIRDQDGCSAISNTIDVATQPAPFGDIVPTKGTGLDYSYYENNSGQPWNNLPDFNALSIVKTGSTPNTDLNLRNRNTNMGFVFEGQIYLPVDGQYVFYTSSDDGSWLQIDNALVVNNGGLHGIQERSGFVNLTKGFHNIRINFFQAGGGLSLTASYQGPGISKQTIPNNVLFRPKPLCLLSPITLASGTATSYAWNTGATTNTITTTTSGTYSVQITGTNGCKSTISESIVLDQLPTVDIVTATPNVGCAGSFTNGLLIANPTGKQPFKYQWKRNGTNITGATSQSYTFNSTGDYAVTLTDACGNSVTSTPFAFEIITQPNFVLSTDIAGTIPTMCAFGNTAKIRVAITGYNNTRSYEVTMNPGAITKIIAPNTVVTQPAIEFPITSPDNYSVTVRDQS